MMLAILDGTSSATEDMKDCERKYLDEMKSGGASNDTRFKYAKSIIRSGHVLREDMDRAIRLLEDLCVSDDVNNRKDYLFCLSIACTEVGDYCRADECVKKFLVLEPGNRQAHELYDIIHEKMRKDRLKEAALAGGTAVLIGGLVGLGMALATRR